MQRNISRHCYRGKENKREKQQQLQDTNKIGNVKKTIKRKLYAELVSSACTYKITIFIGVCSIFKQFLHKNIIMSTFAFVSLLSYYVIFEHCVYCRTKLCGSSSQFKQQYCLCIQSKRFYDANNILCWLRCWCFCRYAVRSACK